MRIHKEGKGILLWSLLGLLLFHFFLIKHTNVSSFGYVFFSISSSLIYLWIVWFFRDPCVSPIIYEQGVISPADGKVIFVHEVYEDEFFKDKRIKISIFLMQIKQRNTTNRCFSPRIPGCIFFFFCKNKPQILYLE